MAVLNTIDYVSPQTTGNAVDFGDLDSAKSGLSACSNNTRGVYAGGFDPGLGTPELNYIGFITIGSLGNASSFGTLTSRRRAPMATASTTYGYFAGGEVSSGTFTNAIDYVTIASTGNGTDFGDLTDLSYNGGGGASPTRGIFGMSRLGASASRGSDTIQYITFSTSGNAAYFGDLSVARTEGGVCSSKTQCIFMGGYDGSSYYNTIDQVTIASTGNATDFGDLINSPHLGAAASNGHGGLS